METDYITIVAFSTRDSLMTVYINRRVMVQTDMQRRPNKQTYNFRLKDLHDGPNHLTFPDRKIIVLFLNRTVQACL